ncbi:MAG: phospholipase A [Spirochaetota bacterium]|nr:phospholipase A [Spirochaetota bacterium]
MRKITIILVLCMLLAIVPTISGKILSGSYTDMLFKKDKTFPLSTYIPMYFVDGHPNAKVLMSFKYQFIESFNLFFGYNQFMFWDIHEKSRPFRDINFNPHLFYHIPIDWGLLDSVQLGIYEHKSNGKDEYDSRSYDSNYLKIIMGKVGKNYILRLTFHPYVLYQLDKTNRNIREYMGWWEADLVAGWLFSGSFEAIALYTRIFAGGVEGTDFSKGGQEALFIIRLNILGAHPAICLQFYHGYAESQLEYDKNETAYRIGLMLYI